jgi:uncharacterized protein
MPLSVHQSSVVAYSVTLEALSKILDKAQAHADARKFDSAVFMTMRLRPDMVTFAGQVMIATDHAKNSCFRLAGVEAPKFEDSETTIAELKARLAKTVAAIASLDAAALEAGAEREIVFQVGPNKMKMRGDNYLLHFALPNYYFHITTAYDILRYAGVEIGKRDFMGAVPGAGRA